MPDCAGADGFDDELNDGEAFDGAVAGTGRGGGAIGTPVCGAGPTRGGGVLYVGAGCCTGRDCGLKSLAE
jgi:hypothetical protein